MLLNLFHQICEGFSLRKPLSLPDGASRAERGAYGEALAARYCKRELGYRVIARNWRYKRDELDIVAKDGPILVFIEVRARAADALVSGYHSVDRKKKAKLLRACKAYIKQLPKPPKHFRFDVIDVALGLDRADEVRHYSNVELFHKHYSVRRHSHD
ncbi:YraN family protein [Coraliomargarita akajimensis]|uniref:UPF0102 protein Caka_2199 n=1 Tax=Coraliomargarita akajimensis (strain DSM 45221 / IAM 15411 / JCM 23193 / KCTC 12865 / 04OKA010-24) TaxID=583355 RepID=D5EM56_CORAD|nr:YraN family protein [Coraliomargarita akajimensis]ADE55216.1 protein of unknown function UPF0102 [Coraliomargarita akajimensis DSM 45221]